jgi:hypothetical protein
MSGKAKGKPDEPKESVELPDWMRIEIPEVPAPDDSALESELDQRFNIDALFRELQRG